MGTWEWRKPDRKQDTFRVWDFEWRKTMLDWQQAVRSSSQRVYYLLQDAVQVREGVMHISPHCFGATSLTQALQNGVFLPRPSRRRDSFLSGHQNSQKWDNSYIGLVLSHSWQPPNICSITGMLLKSGMGEEDKFSRRAYPLKGIYYFELGITLCLHFLFLKGDSPNSPMALVRNRSSRKHGEAGSCTNKAGPSVTHSIQTACVHIQPGWRAQAAVTTTGKESWAIQDLCLRSFHFTQLFLFVSISLNNKTNSPQQNK